MVGRGGFEPPKRSAADLQSAPFGHSGTYPHSHAASASQRWSWRWDLNPQPADYKSAALPIELRQPIIRSTATPFSIRLQVPHCVGNDIYYTRLRGNVKPFPLIFFFFTDRLQLHNVGWRGHNRVWLLGERGLASGDELWYIIGSASGGRPARGMGRACV